MSSAMNDELSRYLVQTDEPEIRARQRRIGEILVETYPEIGDKLVEKGIEKGLAKGLEEGVRRLRHQFERKLGRPLDGGEHRVLQERLSTLGPDRLGDVVLDLDAAALAVWLADAEAR